MGVRCGQPQKGKKGTFIFIQETEKVNVPLLLPFLLPGRVVGDTRASYQWEGSRSGCGWTRTSIERRQPHRDDARRGRCSLDWPRCDETHYGGRLHPLPIYRRVSSVDPTGWPSWTE